MTKALTQIIVNTKGFARTVTQKRDEKGRFVKGGNVSVLLAPGFNFDHVEHVTHPVVIVQHAYTYCTQTVSSVNRTTKRGNAVVFINDGVSKHSQHRNLFETEVK